MPRVAHFEIHADNPERAAKFYRDVFGWQIQKWAGPVEYWLIVTGTNEEPGINGGLMKRHGAINGDSVIAYVCTITVDSLDTYAAKIPQHGGTIVMPKMAIPGVGWSAYAKDTEGNIFGIHQDDPGAK
jgi:predicted enzyme related to lactoylglutathione lyase